MVKAKSIGTGIGAFFNNPGVIILGALAVIILFFQGDIRKAFGSFGGSISEGIGGLGDINITLPEIKFPDFPEIKLPEITLPELPSLPDIFGGGDGVTQVTTPADPDFVPLTPEEQAELPGPVSIVQDAMGIVTRIIRGQPAPPFRDAARFARDFPEPFIPRQPRTMLELPTGFTGGGPSFIGGTIFETPIANLSLFDIIERFMVTASQAANIRAIARDDFGDFDFGTNI